MVVFGQKLLYSGKLVVFGQRGGIRAGGCIWAKMIVLGQIWLYWGEYGCIRAKVVLFGKKWLYFGIMVVFGQSGYIRAKWLFIWAKFGFYLYF